MSQAVVALLAAVVGAAAAIAGQSLTPVLTARKSHQSWVRDKRAALAEQFITALDRAVAEAALYVDLLDRLASTPSPDPAVQADAETRRARIRGPQLLSELGASLSMLRIYGPDSLSAGANKAAKACADFYDLAGALDQPAEEGAVAQLDEKSDDLLKRRAEVYQLIRKALGVTV